MADPAVPKKHEKSYHGVPVRRDVVAAVASYASVTQQQVLAAFAATFTPEAVQDIADQLKEDNAEAAQGALRRVLGTKGEA